MVSADNAPRPAAGPALAGPAPSGPLYQVVRDAEAAPPRFALSVVFTVMGGFFLMQVVDIFEEQPGPLGIALCLTVLPASMALLVAQTLPGLRAFRRRWGRWMLLVQSLFVVVPCLLLGWCWGGMGGFVCASALLVLPTRWAVAVFTALVALIVLGTVLHEPSPATVVPYMVVSTVLTGIIVLSLVRLADLTTAVHTAREEFARTAVSEERLRFAHDLHDLLGYSLSAISLKSALAGQLVTTDPARAQEEVWSTAEVARQALADVRDVTRRYRTMSLLNELLAARGLLAAAGVDTQMHIDYERVSTDAETALATVVREGVTNIIRHSEARTCLLEARQEDGTVQVRLVNDGVHHKAAGPSGGAGCGIHSLTARMTAVGGRLSAGLDDAGRFELLAEMPPSGGDAGQTQPASRAIRTASSRLRAPSFTTEDVR